MGIELAAIMAGVAFEATLSGALAGVVLSGRRKAVLLVLAQATSASLAVWLSRFAGSFSRDFVAELPWATSGAFAMAFLVFGWMLISEGEGALRPRAPWALAAFSCVVYPVFLTAVFGTLPDVRGWHAVAVGAVAAVSGSLSLRIACRPGTPAARELPFDAGKHALFWGLVSLVASMAAAGAKDNGAIAFEPLRLPSPPAAAAIFGVTVLLAGIGYLYGRRRSV